MEAAANIRIPFSGWSYVRPLGSGGFGSVCEIQRDMLGTTEKSAMKMISIPKDPSAIDADRSDGYDEVSIRQKYEDCLHDMVAEYKLMQQLQGNSNIVDCKDIYYEKQGNGIGWNVYIRMELLTPLKDLINAGDLPEETVVVLGKDICRALAACQERNIVHRDIKPENIMASSFGFKLGDFGIARTLDHTTNASITGTERYIAPEVVKREKYGREVDIYSLGLVLYWLLNNRRMPFWPQGNTPPRASEIADAQTKRIQGVPLPAPVHGSPALKQIVLKACAYKPKDRYSSAKEMLTALEGLTRGTVPKAAHSAAAVSAGGSSGSGFGGATIGGEYGRNSIGTDPVYDRGFESGSQSTAGNGWGNGETIGAPNLQKQNAGSSRSNAGVDETQGRGYSKGRGKSPKEGASANSENVIKPISEAHVGDTVIFGKTYRIGNKTQDDLEWIVLDERFAFNKHSLLLLSKYLLFLFPMFNSRYFPLFNRTWGTSSLREYLNTQILKKCFTVQERRSIPLNFIDLTTHNQIFLLSLEQAQKYFASDEDRICNYIGAEPNRWWLRTQIKGTSCFYVVDSKGAVGDQIYTIDFDTAGVRPAMWLDVK